MVSQAPMSEATLDKLQRDTFGYFLKETNRANGMVPDNTRQGAHASIAPIGFALAAYTIGVERGFITRAEAIQRTLTTLRFFRESEQSEGPNATGYKGLFHEQMHDEAITYTRQTLSYCPPAIGIANIQVHDVAVVERVRPVERNPALTQTGDYLTGDAEIPGGRFMLGSSPGEGFVFDNEQRAHEVEIAPFAISKTAVTNAEFRQFMEDAGYRRSELWTAEGWQWRASVGCEHPVYFKIGTLVIWHNSYCAQKPMPRFSRA